MNLLSKEHRDTPASSETFPQFYSKYKSTAEPHNGILGVITSCTVNHGLESEGAFPKKETTNTILPKLIEINVSFTPIHEETIGFTNLYDNNGAPTGKIGNNNPSFPYGVVLKPSVGSVNQGKPPSQLAKNERTLEEARQKRDSAQQERDLAQAKLTRLAARGTRAARAGKTTRREQRLRDNIEETGGYIEGLETEIEKAEAILNDPDFL
jgi:hypothetical protein